MFSKFLIKSYISKYSFSFSFFGKRLNSFILEQLFKPKQFLILSNISIHSKSLINIFLVIFIPKDEDIIISFGKVVSLVFSLFSLISSLFSLFFLLFFLNESDLVSSFLLAYADNSDSFFSKKVIILENFFFKSSLIFNN